MKKSEIFNILVVDDDKSTRSLLKNILEKEGYSVITAENGDEGLCKILKHNIQIVICDIVMPKLDGFEFLRRVHDCLSVQVIMMTGKTDIAKCILSIQLGAVGYLIKPIVAKDLFKLVETAKRHIKERISLFRRLYGVKHKKLFKLPSHRQLA